MMKNFLSKHLSFTSFHTFTTFIQTTRKMQYVLTVPVLLENSVHPIRALPLCSSFRTPIFSKQQLGESVLVRARKDQQLGAFRDWALFDVFVFSYISCSILLSLFADPLFRLNLPRAVNNPGFFFFLFFFYMILDVFCFFYDLAPRS